MAAFDPGDRDGFRKMVQAMPGAVDESIRQAIQFCWMGMPDEKQNVEAVSAEVRRIVERALRNLAEDEANRRPTPPPE